MCLAGNHCFFAFRRIRRFSFGEGCKSTTQALLFLCVTHNSNEEITISHPLCCVLQINRRLFDRRARSAVLLLTHFVFAIGCAACSGQKNLRHSIPFFQMPRTLRALLPKFFAERMLHSRYASEQLLQSLVPRDVKM